QNWPTTKSTAEAVYALLLEGTSILGETDYPKISLGDEHIDLSAESTEDGTGYFKKTWKNDAFSKEFGNVSVEKKDSSVAWGSVYWQYFEDLDNIKSFEDTPLKIRKSLFVNKVEGGREVLVPVTDSDYILKVGDKVTVRVEIETDRNMEYIHLKDMRAACFEPVDKLSGYAFKNGLGYYRSIKDASVDFFIDLLTKGVYVFEYQVVATQKGDFSNGITTIQNMYAPEFSSHSKGVSVHVE
ncbi:MAG: alpha-2-macroglobulin, partial [Bacteroidales bacterium]|nr:alpha-2-macroglobulin [Bacteroidales bacterium]